jgi:hypothetical protein
MVRASGNGFEALYDFPGCKGRLFIDANGEVLTAGVAATIVEPRPPTAAAQVADIDRKIAALCERIAGLEALKVLFQTRRHVGRS